MIEFNDIVNRLRSLREEGQQIVTPMFTVMYNPHSDTFIMDIPEEKKQLALKSEEFEDVFFWDCSGMYPVSVKFNGDYDIVWQKLSAYAEGAQLNMLPASFIYNNKEYVWLEDYENGYLPVEKDKLQIIE